MRFLIVLNQLIMLFVQCLLILIILFFPSFIIFLHLRAQLFYFIVALLEMGLFFDLEHFVILLQFHKCVFEFVYFLSEFFGSLITRYAQNLIIIFVHFNFLFVLIVVRLKDRTLLFKNLDFTFKFTNCLIRVIILDLKLLRQYLQRCLQSIIFNIYFLCYNIFISVTSHTLSSTLL